jgi:hypothetical protein
VSNHTILRIAGIAGILSAVLMLAMTFAGNPNSGLSPLFTVPNVVIGIVFAVGIYLLYRGEQSGLSLAAIVFSVIGYLLFLVASLTDAKFPSPVLSAADILVYIVGMSLFSWLAYGTRKMPRILAIVGFLGALAGVVTYILILGTGASIEQPTPLLSAFYFLYLIGVIVWLAWTGYILLSGKAQLAKA